MMDLMNVLVERAPMERTMRPVMPGVLQYKEYSNLVSAYRSAFIILRSRVRHFQRGAIQHCEERWKWYAGSKAKILSHWVEKPDEVYQYPEVGEWNAKYHI